MMNDLFEEALHIGFPYYVKDIHFDEGKKTLEIWIDFKPGATFSYIDEADGINGFYPAYDTEEKHSETSTTKGGFVMKKFLIIIEDAGDNFSAYSPDLPGCVATGVTREELENNMYAAIQMHIQGLKEDKLPIPNSKSSAEYLAIAV
mgnify:FL=1